MSLDTTMGPTSSTGAVFKSKSPKKIENLVKIKNQLQTLKMLKLQKTDLVNLLLNLLGMTNNYFKFHPVIYIYSIIFAIMFPSILQWNI